jgi:hypothetical protein
MQLFTTGDVLRITGLPPSVWCRDGVVKSIDERSGTGNHRRFTTMQVVGIAVAAEVRDSEQGCSLSYVQKVVEAFANMDESELVKTLQKKGTTHFAGLHHGSPILNEKKYTRPDVRAIYQHVTETVAERVRQSSNPTGRSCGLAPT